MSLVPTSIAEKLLGVILDFLKKGGENLINDVAAKNAIKKAIEYAAERFGDEYSDKGLAKALVVNTKLHDLPSVQNAIQTLLQHPFDPAPQVEVENEFAAVLSKNQKELAGGAAQFYLEILREELIGVEKLHDKLKLILLKRTAEATERTADGVEKLVEMQKKSSTEKKPVGSEDITNPQKSSTEKSVSKRHEYKLPTPNLILRFQKIAKNVEFDEPVPVTVLWRSNPHLTVKAA